MAVEWNTLVPLRDTIRDIESILNGRYDDRPEDDFYFIGSIV